MTDRSCPGYCCRTIHQPMDHATLKRFADVLLDGHQIAAMLEPTGGMVGGKWRYTCRNWDPDTRLCRDYENRPAICRDYPYGQTCEHCGLTFGTPPQERLHKENQWRRTP